MLKENGQQTEVGGGTAQVGVVGKMARLTRRAISRLEMEVPNFVLNGLNWTKRIGNG